MKEKETSLAELVYSLLLRWRMFLVWMVIGAVAFGIFGYIQSKNAAEAEASLVEEGQQLVDELKVQYGIEDDEGENSEDMAGSGEPSGSAEEVGASDPEELLQQSAAKLTAKQLANVDYVLECERIYGEREDYLENSVILQMDAQDVKKALVTAWIDVGSEDGVSAGTEYPTSDQNPLFQKSLKIALSYANAFRTGDAAQYVSGQVGLAAPYLMELITASAQTSGSVYGLTVEVIHSDAQECDKIAQAVANYLGSKQDEIAQDAGEFELDVSTQGARSVQDQNIIAKQQDAYDKALALKNAIEDRKAAFSLQELRYYDVSKSGEVTELSAHVEEELAKAAEAAQATQATAVDMSKVDLTKFNESLEEGEPPIATFEDLEAFVEQGVTTTVGLSVKYLIIGALVAAVIYGIYASFAYSFRAKVADNDDFMELYGIGQLGRILTQPKKRFFGSVDAWILSKRDRKRRKFSLEETIQLASVAIQMAVGSKSADAVSLVCCGLQKEDLEICAQMKDRLENENVKTSILNNVLYDAGTMRELENAKTVVLVARSGSTFYDELTKEMEFLSQEEIPVLGGIVIA